jgi:PAS domain S-box-containing protein
MHKSENSKKPVERELPHFESSLFFSMMFENAEFTAILVMDPGGIILDANYGFKRCFGYSKESLVGRNFSVLFIEEDIEKHLPEKELKEVMTTGSSNDENYLRQADGSSTWVHGESIYAKDTNGYEFIVKVIQDINEEKILEQELKKINEEQERVIIDRENFIYTASHDLQSPINNIEGLVKAMRESPAQDSDILLSMMEKSISRFKNKITELSAIGKELEEAKKDPEDVKFEEVFKEVLLDLEQEINSSEGDIISDFSKAPIVRISKNNLKSILQNLISNAVKYRSPDRKLQVVVDTRLINGDYAVLSVRDNGIGIKEEDKDKVFRMYQRLHNDSKGTGVGMAIVKRVVDNAGGKIELNSKVGEGSAFDIYLPL